MSNSRVLRNNLHVEHCAAFGLVFPRQEFGPKHDLGRRAHTRHLALIEHHDVGSQPRDLGDRMADIDNRDFCLVAQPLDIGKDFGLARLVQRGERFVHQDQSRARRQRPADRDALLLAARQGGRPAIHQVSDAQQLHDLVEVGIALRRRCKPAAIAKVLRHRQMRKQSRVLEHIADPAAMFRHEDSRCLCRQTRVRPTSIAAIRRPEAARRSC